MIIDAHVHLCPMAEIDSRLNSEKDLYSRVYNGLLRRTPAISEFLIEEPYYKLQRWLEETSVDKIMVLALDAYHEGNGVIDKKQTSLHVNNCWVQQLCAKFPEKLLFGGSVHPYRQDALKELEKIIELGVSAIKWLPSAQGIDPSNERCIPFYEKLATAGIPLLIHTGREHILGKRHLQHFNSVKRLCLPLSKGVTIIAAHCSARLFPFESSEFEDWAKMTEDFENLYGDTGCFLTPARINILSRILKNRHLSSRLVYGSDLPTYGHALSLVWKTDFRASWKIHSINNPFEKCYQAFRALNVPEDIFTRASKLLRLPALATRTSSESLTP